MSYQDRPTTLEDQINAINEQLDKADASNTQYTNVNIIRTSGTAPENYTSADGTTTGTISSQSPLAYQFTKSDGTGATNPGLFNFSSFIGGP